MSRLITLLCLGTHPLLITLHPKIIMEETVVDLAEGLQVNLQESGDLEAPARLELGRRRGQARRLRVLILPPVRAVLGAP